MYIHRYVVCTYVGTYVYSSSVVILLWLVASFPCHSCHPPRCCVAVRPVISVNPADQVVETGAMATISCHVIGTPLPVVTWMGTDNAPITSAISGEGVGQQVNLVPTVCCTVVLMLHRRVQT